ncbi:MAG: DUF2284 domain-containing protein [Treponema sp.]|nr:DUF2284 domain-containing protein [Treponema sp.]
MDAELAPAMALLEETAAACGFSQTGRFETAAIVVRKEVRDACAEDKCNAFGKNWSCPPACGSLEECERKIRRYRCGLILQSTGNLEDSFDFESIERIGKEHSERIARYRDRLEQLLTAERPWLLLGAGGCKNCAQCSCPASPCVAPEKMVVSMEAMGIVVSELCKASDIPYYYGPNTLTFVGCVMV